MFAFIAEIFYVTTSTIAMVLMAREIIKLRNKLDKHIANKKMHEC